MKKVGKVLVCISFLTMLLTGCSFSISPNSHQPGGDEEIIDDGIECSSYTFSNKSWESNEGKWSATKDGNNYSNGVQVTTSLSGVAVTSQDNYTSIQSIAITYHTNRDKGAGSISVYVGETLIAKQNVTKEGGTSDRTLKYSCDSLNGAVKFVVECTTNSIYISKIEIEHGDLIPIEATSIAIDSNNFELAIGKTKQLSVIYTPKNANTNKEVIWSSDNQAVATVDSTGLVSIKEDAAIGGSANITATLASNNYQTSVKVTVTEIKSDAYTVLIYLCGSDLESGWDGQRTNLTKGGYATEDIKEILAVKNQPEDVNIVIETGGAKAWKSNYGISSKYLQRHHVENGKLVTDASLSNVSMGKSSTLQSFLEYGLQNYPAEKTALILWNHGGALSGVCYDENFTDKNGQSDCLLASEVESALKGAFNSSGLTVGQDKLEWIGYDACLMAVQDIAEINSKYFNYMVASEESEAGEGWEYTSWLDDLYSNKSTETILKAICDGFIDSYDKTYGKQGYDNDQTLAYYDLNKMDAYKNAFEALATTMSSTIKNNTSTFNSLMKTVKAYGDTYLEKSDYQYYLQNYGYSDYMFDKVVLDGETYYLLHGYYDYGTFDARDALTKIKANSKFGSFASEINNVLNLLDELVVYSAKGNEAGESNGLCLVCPMDSYLTTDYYKDSESNFDNWRSLVNSRSL